jgi:Trk K+ transport system NAD-binding subunit
MAVRNDVELVEFVAGSAIHNRKVADVQLPNQLRICLVTREALPFIPWRETILKERDVILALVKDSAHDKIQQYMREA